MSDIGPARDEPAPGRDLSPRALLSDLGRQMPAWIEILELDPPNPQILQEWERELRAAAKGSIATDNAVSGESREWEERSPPTMALINAYQAACRYLEFCSMPRSRGEKEKRKYLLARDEFREDLRSALETVVKALGPD